MDYSPRVAILGPVMIAGRDGALIEPPGALAPSLIRSLALARNQAVGTAALIDELWGDAPPGNAKAALHTLVSRVRAIAADGLVVSTATGYRLGTDATGTDVGRARDLLAEARSLQPTDPRAARDRVDGALALWRGDSDDAPDAVHRLRTDLTILRVELLATLGDHAAALRELDVLAGVDPLNEQIVLAQLTNLAAVGRRNDAIRLFGEFRTRLRDALGTSPSRELVDFNAELLRTDADASTDVAGPAENTPTAPERRRIGVRLSPNRLLGRDDDLTAVEQLLADGSLVTILGPGGLGKTRLAQEIARRSASSAVIVVELASVASNDDVTLALASTLGIRERSANQRLAEATLVDLRTRVLSQLAETDTLVVLDNCEHVIDGAARWAADILAGSPSVRVLATSRSPLVIGAEQVYPLGVLSSEPDAPAGAPAVQLFIDRALAARPGATLPLDQVARLCTTLDGLPLAIELAAARIRSMSVDEIERRLDNRFSLLTTGDRSAPERHRTLQAVIDWSWTMLSTAEQTALRRLSRFADGFGTVAAQALIPEHEVADLLDALVMQSLLGVSEDATTGELRYRMLETVREFGARELERAQESELVQSALFDWAEEFCLTTYPLLDGRRQLERYRLIRLEHDNLLAILRQAIAAERPDIVVSVFAVLAQYWTIQSNFTEVGAFAPSILAATRGYLPDAAHRDVAAASYILAGTILGVTSDRLAAPALSALRRLLRTQKPDSPRLLALAGFLLDQADPVQAMDRLAEMRRSPDESVALVGHLVLSQLAENDGDVVLAAEAGYAAWTIASANGDTWASSMSATMLAQLASQQNRPAEALSWADKAEVGLRALNAREDLHQLNWMRGSNLLSLGRLEEASALFHDFLDTQIPSAQGIDLQSIGLSGLAELARAEGRFADAAELYQRTVDTFSVPRDRASPWFLMVTAGLISAWVLDGTGDATSLAGQARILRARILALRRARPAFVDKPVLGTTALAYATWSLTLPERQASGVELLALAEGLHPRQDLPVLHVSEHLAHAEHIVGAAAVDEARSRVTALTLDERANRAHEVFVRPV